MDANDVVRPLPLAVAAVLLAAGLAGCIGGDEPSPSQAAAPQRHHDRFALGPIRTPLRCGDDCYEPTVATAPNGTLYTTTGPTDAPIALSRDGGETWTHRPVPPLPPTVPDSARRDDALVSVAPNGDLWYTALVYELRFAGSVGVLHAFGIQVAVSEDAGETWRSNQLVAPTASPTWSADRQWVVFAPDGTAYLSAKALARTHVLSPAGFIPPGGLAPDQSLWVTRSDDGGASFSSWTQATDLARGMTSGRPAVIGADRLVLPYISTDGLKVATTTDGAETWTQTTVSEDGGSFFPVASTDSQGRVHLAWRGPDEKIRYARSVENTREWTNPFILGPGNGTTPSGPWVHARGENVSVAWFEHDEADNETGNISLVYARLPANGTGPGDDLQKVVVAEKPPHDNEFRLAGTEFAHAAQMPGGGLVLAWNDPVAAKVHLRTVEVGPS